MSAGPIEIAFVNGSVLPDMVARDANLRHAKARLGARIVKILEETGLSIRQAEVRTGVSHIDLSRIRQEKLRRFTLDRLMAILENLGQDVEVSVTVHPRAMRQTAYPR